MQLDFIPHRIKKVEGGYELYPFKGEPKTISDAVFNENFEVHETTPGVEGGPVYRMK